jgi:flagellar biosynthesis regulator FlbT
MEEKVLQLKLVTTFIKIMYMVIMVILVITQVQVYQENIFQKVVLILLID